MYKLELTLRQHTPLIHFHNQEQALLRTTELKPKLDRFLAKSMSADGDVDTKYVSWLIENTKKSFDYKIRINTSNVVLEEIPKGVRTAFYFGNMGPEYEDSPKYWSYTESPITIVISTFNSTIIDDERLIDYIRTIIPSFFLSENFGTRQSKGFGSFYLDPGDKLYVSPDDEIEFKQEGGFADFLPFSFSISNNINGFLQKALKTLEDVEVFYKAMRSGINVGYGIREPHHYLKSLLWLYFKTRLNSNIKWEKKKIKETFLGGIPDLRRQISEHSKKPAYNNSPLGFSGTDEILIKDLFGLATDEKWEAKYGGFLIQKKVSHVERFKSPVFFKPIRQNNRYIVFFHAEELNEINSILSKTVEINGRLRMNTPQRFDFHNLFNFLGNPALFNLDDHFLINAENTNTGNVEYMKVTDIREQGSTEFNQVKNYRILNNIIEQLKKKHVK